MVRSLTADCIARIVLASHDLFGWVRKLCARDRRFFATHARKLAARIAKCEQNEC